MVDAFITGCFPVDEIAVLAEYDDGQEQQNGYWQFSHGGLHRRLLVYDAAESTAFACCYARLK